MTITVSEFRDTDHGKPVYPPQRRATGQALGVAFQCQGADCVLVTPTEDVHLRVSLDGAAATTADPIVPAGGVAEFLTGGRGVQVYALATP